MLRHSVVSSSFDNFRYNALPGIFEADKAAKDSNTLEKFLADAAPVFHKHEVNSEVGVFLLHKHNNLTSKKIMIEYEGEYSGESALITSARTADEAALPARWAVSKSGEYMPLEFTYDAMAAASLSRLHENSKFLGEFSMLVRKHDVNNLFGLCLADRGFFQDPPVSSAMLVEESYPHVGNVVRWTTLDYRSDDLIQTIWTFPATLGPGCVPMCKRYCVPRSPGHAREHYPIHGIIA